MYEGPHLWFMLTPAFRCTYFPIVNFFTPESWYWPAISEHCWVYNGPIHIINRELHSKDCAQELKERRIALKDSRSEGLHSRTQGAKDCTQGLKEQRIALKDSRSEGLHSRTQGAKDCTQGLKERRIALTYSKSEGLHSRIYWKKYLNKS